MKNPYNRIQHIIFYGFLIAIILTPLTFPAIANAAVYYVNGASGNDANSGTTQTTAFKSITKANQVVKGGDTVIIATGTYTGQSIRPATSGTANARISYTVIPGASVIIESSISLLNLADRSYISVTGPITFRNPGAEWASIRNGTQNEVIGNTFIGNGKKNYSGFAISTGATYTRIINNTFRDWGSTDSQWGDTLRIEGSTYTLVEGNRFINAGHALIDLNSSHTIVRNNYLENNWQKGMDVVWRSVATEYNVIENNIFKRARPALGGSKGGMNMQLAAPRTIVRRNVFLDGSIAGIELNAFTESPNATFNRIYHNTFVGNGFASGTLRGGFTATNWGTSSWNVGNTALKNNIFTRNNNSGVQIAIELGGGTYNATYFNSSFQISGNCLSAQPDIRISSLDGRQTILSYQQKYPFVQSNIVGTPQFVDEAANNFALRANSACIDSGVALTTTRAAGSGTTVPVQDALYFTDGKGLVSADQVIIGSNTPVMVTSVNYSTNTLTVSRSLSWSSGDPVHLPYAGSAPDSGAFELQSASTTPTSTPTLPAPTVTPTRTPTPVISVPPSATPFPSATPTTPHPTGYQILPVVAVTASSHDGNRPENTVDNNFSTRWSACGDGQWIRYDLGKTVAVSQVNIAFYLARTQIALFDIDLSPDGTTWYRVLSGQSSPVEKFQSFPFASQSARYVRYMGHGNLSVQDACWNSLTEVQIVGSAASPSQSPACSLKSQGDADCNGVVNLADFEIWRKEYASGCSSAALQLCGADENKDGNLMDADFDNSGFVNLGDFETWRKGFMG